MPLLHTVHLFCGDGGGQLGVRPTQSTIKAINQLRPPKTVEQGVRHDKLRVEVRTGAQYDGGAHFGFV